MVKFYIMTIPEIQTQLKKAQKEQDVVFTDRGHTYAIEGKYLTGTTIILEQKAQAWKPWWTVKMMYTFMKDKLAVIKHLTPPQYEELLLEGKKAHTQYSGTAAKAGKDGHKVLEKYVKAKLAGEPIKLWIGGEKQNADEKKIQKSFTAFLKWEKDHNVEWIASEVVVASQEHMVGGTIDALAMVDGIFTVIDFKFSNQLDENTFLQIASYLICLEEMGLKPQGRMILRILKTGGGIEAYRVPTDIEFDKEIFLGLRQVHRWDKYVLNNLKGDYGLRVPLEAKIKPE